MDESFVAEQSAEAAGEGRTSQNITNALALSTVILGLATAAIGIFAVDWKPQKPAVSGGISLAPGGKTPRLFVTVLNRLLAD
mgnify:CR=1 FL=1